MWISVKLGIHLSLSSILPLLPVSSAEDFFIGINDFCCCNELAPDPFLAGALGFPAGDPLRYSLLDDVTAEVDVVSEDAVRPFCDVLDVRNDDFANVVLSGDLLRRSGDSRSQK